MPYADPKTQAAYQAEWMARRRTEWFAANGPCQECGSDKDLQLDHEDPKQKVSHRIWSWSKARREVELAKCRVLCRPCHDRKSADEKAKGEDHWFAKLSDRQVLEVRERFQNGETTRQLADAYGLNIRTVQRVVYGSTSGAARYKLL